MEKRQNIMKVLVDTCIWSKALRKTNLSTSIEVVILEELIRLGRVQIMGPIRQELLSGIHKKSDFEILSKKLQAFPDLFLQTSDYELAAKMFNLCRTKGVQGSNTDFLICAVSKRYQYPVFTQDKDFQLFAKYLPIQLFRA